MSMEIKMIDALCIDENYSTTRLLSKEKPVIESKPEDKFETVLSLPEGKNRKGEGGLRTQGYFKKSYDDKPLISIITVVFNGEKYLEQTIQSVINQTYDNVEYIIIDGGSADGTLDIIKKYEKQIDYWVSEEDTGIYDAMNKGGSLAVGDFLLWLNADDTLIGIPELDISYDCYLTKVLIYDEGSKNFKEYARLDKYVNCSSLIVPVFHHQGFFIKKNIFLSMGYDTGIGIRADTLFMYLVLRQLDSDKIKIINQSFVQFRLFGESDNMKLSHLLSMKKTLDFANCPSLFVFIKNSKVTFSYMIQIFLPKKVINTIRRVKWKYEKN